MHSLDWIIIGAYFFIVFAIAWWATAKERKSRDGLTSDGYFLAGRSEGWLVIGASLFASNIGSEHLVGLTGSGAKGDMAAAQFEILAALMLLLLGWVFVPFYLRSGVFTMPEFLERRYSSGARTYLSVVSIIAYILTKISFTIFAGALVFEVLLGIPFWTGAVLVVVATGVYTVFGGLKAVIYTDMIQMFVLVGGSLAVTLYGLKAAGGWDQVVDTVYGSMDKGAADNYFNLWPTNNSNYPWTGIIFGAPILGVWYWCTDQFIVQRVLSARNLSNARQGTIFAGFLKLLPLFLFIVPGIIAYSISVHQADLFTLTNPITGEVRTETDAALPALIQKVLPTGLRGLVVAGLLAALMSSLSSVFNSCSTLFTLDFYKTRRPQASEMELVNVGRIATVVLVLIGLAWIPLMRALTEEGGVYQYLQSIQAYISPPIAAVFLIGIFYKRINAQGAMAALWTGFVLGIGRLVLEILTNGYKDGTATWNIAPDSFVAAWVGINFLHYAILLFAICSVVLIAVSMAGQPLPAAQLKDVTYEPSAERVPLLSNSDFWLSMLLVAGVLGLWLWFSPWGFIAG